MAGDLTKVFLFAYLVLITADTGRCLTEISLFSGKLPVHCDHAQLPGAIAVTAQGVRRGVGFGPGAHTMIGIGILIAHDALEVPVRDDTSSADVFLTTLQRLT